MQILYAKHTDLIQSIAITSVFSIPFVHFYDILRNKTIGGEAVFWLLFISEGVKRWGK